MGSEALNLHILFFPLMAPGHMLPMVDMAKLFAAREVKITIVTTPANASLIQATIDRANWHVRHRIGVVLVQFPSAAAGLPEGCENLASIPSRAMGLEFLKAISILRQPFEQVLKEHLPDCIITDAFFPWTLDIASELGIPRIVFHGSCFFSLCVMDSFHKYNPCESLPSDVESFVLPGLPHRIKMLKSQIPDYRANPEFMDVLKRMTESEMRSYGEVVNSFYELEPDYAQHFRKVVGRKAWHVGPVSLCNRDVIDKATRGDEASIDHNQLCLNWLDKKKPGSVVYVCFGSLFHLTIAQLREIALGLEASHHSFVWVVKEVDGEAKSWLPEGYEERITKEGRGLIIRGWAPQILILNHPAVGGFMTHCGWNSSLESISAGVPMITWPLFAEQFYNERLIVDVLRIGIGIKEFVVRDEDLELVKEEEVENAVVQLMGDGEEADGRRKRARELREMAKRAMEEGGSSYVDLGNLIEELIDRKTIIVKD